MILVTGGTGMVGRALQRKARRAGSDRFEFMSSATCDLRVQSSVMQLIQQVRPEVVIHLAATVGGILANSARQYDFATDNLFMNTNLIHACVRNGVKRMVCVSSTCAYPAHANAYPMNEAALHSGPPEETNYGYAHAKRMMSVQLRAAREQYGLESCVLYPSNLYGPNDTFDSVRSHVVPAVMLKLAKAVVDDSPSVEFIGTGCAMRQLTFVDDLAGAIVECLESEVNGEFNFANSINHQVRNIIEMIRDVVGYRGEIAFVGGHDGVYRKDVDSSKLLAILGTKLRFTSLREGLQRTWEWYKCNAVR